MGGCNTKDSAVSEPKKHGAMITAFKSADELKDFDTFFMKETKSELSKCLTREIWEEYKDMKCAEGVSFKTCIFSGIKNQDSGIGVYAGSHDSYRCFNKLFDQVIKNYHGHGVEDTHKSGMTTDTLERYELSEEDAAMIVSTRIRVGRNLKNYPLGPGVTKEQRLEIMKLVVEAAETFDDDLKGKFYPLEGMSPADQKQLIEDHFLFK
jgi:creatine kinase/arginine kinase